MNTIAFSCLEIDVTPTISAALYSSGKQLGGIQTLTSVCSEMNRISQLLTCTVIDIDNQQSAMNILLFNQSPTLTSVDAGTFAMTAANNKTQLVGSFSIAGSDYLAAGGYASASIGFPNSFFQSLDGAGKLYAVAVCTGTPTYTTTSSLVFKWVFAKHF